MTMALGSHIDLGAVRRDGPPVDEILFVDPDVADVDILLAGLARPVRLVRLCRDGDPLGQIAVALAGERDIARLSILAHGEPGALRLAGVRVDRGRLIANTGLLNAIRSALAADAVVALHACAVAAGPEGADFVASLADTLGVLVDASSVPLGGAAGWDGLPGHDLPYSAAARAGYPHCLASTFDFSTAPVTGSNTATLTQTVNGVTVTATMSNGGNLTLLSGGIAGDYLAAAVAGGATMTLTFSASVNVTGITFYEAADNSAGANYSLSPSSGTAITASDNSFFAGFSIYSPSDWTGITTITVSYAGSSFRPAVDSIMFTVPAPTAAATTAAAFNTTTGADLTPSFTFGSAAETLTIASSTHIAGSTANGGAGTDTIIAPDGSDFTGFASLTSFEVLTLNADASVTMSAAQHNAFSIINGNTGVETITLASGSANVTGSGGIETYVLGSSYTGTFTVGTPGQSVTGGSGDDKVSIGAITASATIAGGSGTDTLTLVNGANIASATLSGFETVNVQANSTASMASAQHNAFTTFTDNASQTVILASGSGAVTGNAAIETYNLGSSYTGTFTVGTAAQNVAGSSGADTIDVGTLAYTGTITGEGTVNDTLSIGNGGSIADATISGVENLTLATNGTASMTLTQLSGFTGTVTATGTETLNLSGDGNFSTVSNIENYVFGDDSTNVRTITIAQAGASVTATSSTDGITFDGGALTLAGTLTGDGTIADTLSLEDSANIAGATISGITNLTLAGSGAAVTMTAAQLAGFAGTVTAAGTNTVTLTSTGDVSAASLGNIEGLTTAADLTAQTVTLTAAQAVGKTLTAGDAGSDHFVITGSAGNQLVTGSLGADSISGGAGNDTLVGGAGDDSLVGDGNDDVISGGSGFDTLVGGAGDDVFTGAAADLDGDVIGDFAVGDSIVVTGADLSALNNTIASGTIDFGGGQSLSLTGITAANGIFKTTVNGGDTTITLGTASSGGGDSGGGSSGTLVVNDTSGNSTGGARTITNNGTTSGSAAIVQNTSNNGNLVIATLPASVSISSDGPSTAQSGSDAQTTLIGAINARGSTGTISLDTGAQTFLNTLGSTTPLDIRTIVPSFTGGVSTDDPIVITGSSVGSQSEAFVIDMRSITGRMLQLDNIEFAAIIGNATVNGGAGNNYAVGDDADQFISLGEGDDTLYGGAGNDTIGSGNGIDHLFGNEGDDRVFGGTDADIVYGNQQNDVVYGNQGTDTLYGGQDMDTLYGGQDGDLVYGNRGDDLAYGNLGDDTLYGGQGNDTLSGGAGNDVLVGGAGNDLIVTGGGSDTVAVADGSGIDTVSDFDGASGDRIEIASNINGSGIDSFAELKAVAVDDGDGNAAISLGGGNTLVLTGVKTSDLQSDWFAFI